MKCKHCGAFVSQQSIKCNNCHQFSGYFATYQEMPTEDMFGYPVYRFCPNSDKEIARKKYLQTLPEYKQLDENTNVFTKRLIWGMLLLVAIFLLTLGAGMASIFLELEVAVWVFFLPLLLYIPIIRWMVPNKEKRDFRKQMEFHDLKDFYYANNNVIGYSYVYRALHHPESNRTYYEYAFCELDKRNIRTIYYDSRQAEYVLSLYRPIYAGKDMIPMSEFRIADVFDDEVLIEALGCDLPPKKIFF